MSKGASRSKRKKANELQKAMLRSVIEHDKNAFEQGDTFAVLNAWKQFHDLGLVSDKNYQEILDLAVINEGLRKIAEAWHSEKTEEPPELDTSKLYPGQVVPNYRKLCELLNVEPTTGEAKKNQEKFFLRFFDFEKLQYGNEILIFEIYPEPLPPEKTKQYRKSLYSNQLKVLIMYEIADFCKKRGHDSSIHLTFSKLIERLGLVNCYFFNKEMSEFFVDKFEAVFWDKQLKPEKTKQKFRFFFSNAYGKMKNAISYALNALKKEKLLIYEGYNVIVSLDGVHSRATSDEEILIQKHKTEVAALLGYKNSYLASLCKKEEFNRMLTKLYQEHNWDYTYYLLKITPLGNFQERCINSFTAYDDSRKISELTKADLIQFRDSFNKNLCAELIAQIENKKEKELTKWTEELKENQPDIFDDMTELETHPLIEWYGKEYIEERILFIDYLIKSDDAKNKEVSAFIEERTKKQKEEETELLEWVNLLKSTC